MPFRFDRAKVYVGNFSYQGIARLKPGVTIEQANADVARMLPLTVERFPLPPGFSRQMFDDAQIGPLVRPLSAGRDRRCRPDALDPARHGRPRPADRLRQRRQPVPGAGRRAAAGARDPCGARRELAADHLGAAVGEPHARGARRRRRSRPGIRRHPRARRDRARRPAARRGDHASIRRCCSSRS